MRHEQLQENLSEYIEGGLDPAMALAVENHVRECADCYRELTTLRSLFAMLEKPGIAVEPPAGFHDDVMRRVRVQQREAALAKPAAGALPRFRWGWAALAAGGLAAVALVAGPLHNAAPAGWLHARPGISATQGPALLIGADGTPARVGQDVRLDLHLAARAAGTWRVIVQSSPGASVVGVSTPPVDGEQALWSGALKEGGQVVPLLVRPSRRGAVEEIVVRLQNDAAGLAIQRVVFLPVETGGSVDAAVDWHSRPNETLRSALVDAARAYGTPVVAPASVLDDPAAPQMQGANAASALPAIAQSQRLRATLYNNAYNLN